jgi:hypothetical protein
MTGYATAAWPQSAECSHCGSPLEISRHGASKAHARVDSLPAVASSADELLAARVLLAIIAALAAVLVPGHAKRLIDTPLNLGGLRLRLRRSAVPCSPPENVWVVSIGPGDLAHRADRSR